MRTFDTRFFCVQKRKNNSTQCGEDEIKDETEGGQKNTKMEREWNRQRGKGKMNREKEREKKERDGKRGVCKYNFYTSSSTNQGFSVFHQQGCFQVSQWKWTLAQKR